MESGSEDGGQETCRRTQTRKLTKTEWGEEREGSEGVSGFWPGGWGLMLLSCKARNSQRSGCWQQG